jgi:hypothetical protein
LPTTISDDSAYEFSSQSPQPSTSSESWQSQSPQPSTSSESSTSAAVFQAPVPAQRTNKLEQNSRGRRFKDWSNKIYTDGLLEGIDINSHKYKLIKNRISSGLSRERKRLEKRCTLSDEDKLKKIFRENRELLEKKRKNAEKIMKLRAILERVFRKD